MAADTKRKSDKVNNSNSSAAKKSKLEANGNNKANDSTLDNEDDKMAFDPVYFVRSHSKNNDPADIQTQIWEVVFEPDPEDAKKTTSVVATCGGHSICLIDINSGQPLMKYKHKDLKENFYTLAWTTMQLKGGGATDQEEKTNILVSGGIRGEICLFHPKHRVCFYMWRPVEKRTIAVNSLVFHSERPTWLFCGTSDGYVTLWDIGTPSLPSYDGVSPVQLLRLFPDYGDVYNIAWTGDNRWLLAGTAAGLVGWNIEDDKVIDKSKSKEYKPTMIDFIMPENSRDEGENPICDSLAVASTWTVVSKCALHGLIYVWDLKATLDEITKKGKLKEAEKESNNSNGSAEGANVVVEHDVTMLAKLRWSDTDNFYMNLGCHKGKGLIACGDDKGSLWLYNLPQFGKDGAKEIKEVVEPSTKLAWPELQDDHLENSRKVVNDIIIDKVAASHDNSAIVAVTSNNMVCIWRRSSGEDDDPAEGIGQQQQQKAITSSSDV